MGNMISMDKIVCCVTGRKMAKAIIFRVKNPYILIFAGFLFVIVNPGGAREAPVSHDRVKISADYWMSSIHAEVEYQGDKFSLDEDFSLSPRKDIVSYDLHLRWRPDSGIFISHVSPSYAGKDELLRDITFGGVTFPEGAEVGYDLQISFTDIFYKGGLANFSDNSLYILFGIKISDIFIQLEGVDAHPGVFRRVQDELMIPVPLLGLWFSGNLPGRFSYEIQGRGVGLPLEGFRFGMLDAGAGVNFEVHENFRAGVGYRMLIISAEVDDSNFKTTIDGLTLRGILRF